MQLALSFYIILHTFLLLQLLTHYQYNNHLDIYLHILTYPLLQQKHMEQNFCIQKHMYFNYYYQYQYK